MKTIEYNPTKERLVISFLSMFLAIIIMFILYFVTGWLAKRDNAFLRLVPPHAAVLKKSVPLGVNSYYLAGITGNEAYLGNYTSIAALETVNLPSLDRKSSTLSLNQHKIFTTARLSVDSTHRYVLDGVAPQLLQAPALTGDTGWRQIKTINFITAKPLSGTSFILRIYQGTTDHSFLVKQSGETFVERLMLPQQIDGLFSTEGTLAIEPDSNWLVYTYRFQNTFLCLDTNLHVRYRGKTIDTVAHPGIKVARLAAAHKVTLASPPMTVNKQCCIAGNYLFVLSALQANNETSAMFANASPVDVYNVKNGRYLFSLYLPHFSGEPCRQFLVHGDYIIGLFGRFLCLFELHIPEKLRV